MIIIKEEFTAGQFDLPYVKIYSNITPKIEDVKTNKIYIAVKNRPLAIEKYRLENIKEKI